MASKTTKTIAVRLPLADVDRLDALRMTFTPPTWRSALEWMLNDPDVKDVVRARLEGNRT